jgi:DNA polymerase-3 subunit delta
VTPQQFLAQIKKEPAPAYLFLGPEPYQRDYCRKALIQRLLPDPQDREGGLTRHDLAETSLAAVLDDASSLSLFASERVIVVGNAEAVLPRGKAAASEEEEDARPASGGEAALAAYFKDPPPGVALVFEAVRYGFQGDDKKKLDRVRKFYSAVPAEVEFAPMSVQQARQFAQNMAQRVDLKIGPAELDLLVEALGGDAARIAVEIEKLQLYAGGREIGEADIGALAPEARESTIFALVGAVGRGDRVGSLDVLDTLVRQSEYLPLALSFLGTQFRLALAAKEAGLRGPQQMMAHFSRLGVPMWTSRAQQVSETMGRFSKKQLAGALEKIYAADKSLRDARPDDRVVMEDFILRLTG